MYDRSEGPREGTSAISSETRERIYGRKKKRKSGNPNVPAGAFGGQEDANSFDGPPGGWDGNALGQMFMQLLAQSAQQRGGEASDFLRTKAEVRDPVGWAIKQGEAGNIARNADPWGPGGQFEGHRAADIMSPEEIMASQGRTAGNQWASLRPGISQQQKDAGEFNPDELRRLNEMRRRTYL